MEDNDSPDSKLTESQQTSFRSKLNNLRHAADPITFFILQWKDMESHLESQNNVIEARFEKLREKENWVNVGLEQIEKQKAELGFGEKSLEGKLKEAVFAERLSLEKKRKELDRDFAELRVREKEIEETRKGLELKEREIEIHRESVCEGLRLKEREVEARQKAFELKERECGKKLEELEGLKQRVLKVLKLKDSKVEEQQEGDELKESVLKDLRMKESRVEKKRKELELKEKHLEERFSVLRSSEMEIQKGNERVLEELRVKEKEVDEKQKGLELKEREIERQRESVCEGLRLKEREVEARQKGIELKERECGKKLEELEGLRQRVLEVLKLNDSEVEERREGVELNESVLKDWRMKESLVEKKRKELDMKEKYLEEQFSVLRSSEMEIQKGNERALEELRVKEKEVEEKQKGLEVKEIECEKKLEELERLQQVASEEFKLKDKEFEAREREIGLKEMQCKELDGLKRLKKSVLTIKKNNEKPRKDLKLVMKDLEERFSMQRRNKMEIEKWSKELELKDKQLEERFRKVDIKEKKVGAIFNAPLWKESLDIDNANSDASVSFCVKIDGKGLQIFLNETERDGESLRDEVIAVLRLSSDPAKLVLDAIQGLNPPHLMKGEIDFKENVVRRSCVLLLEQLRKISFEIKPHVKKEATELALDWKRKMIADNKHSAEVLGFLLFLACYGLTSECDADDLLHYLEIIAHESQAPELFRVFGLADHISRFVKKLIRKRKLIEAVDFVYAFDLVSEFPPVPLLKEFLESSKTAARNVKKYVKDINKQIEVARQRLNDVKAALKRIQDHNIASDFSLQSLEHQIFNLKMEISEMNKKLQTLFCTAPSTHLDMRTQSSRNDVAAAFTFSCDPTSALAASPELVSSSIVCTATTTLSHQQIGVKRPHSATAEDFAVPLAEIPSQNLPGSSGTEVPPHMSVKLEQPSGESFDFLPSEHGSLQQQKKSADCCTEATPDIEPGEFIAPNLCPNPTVACASITDASQSSDFSSSPVHEQVAVKSPSATSASTDILAPARTVKSSQNTAIRKLTFGSSPLPTASLSASKTVAPSSTSSTRLPFSSKTQRQHQAQSKRQKMAASSGTPFKPRKSASTIVHPMQPPLHQP